MAARVAPRVVADADEATGAHTGFRALVDGLPVGVMWLDRLGHAVEWNDSAELFLRSAAGPRLEDTISRLHAACTQTGTCISTHFELGGGERLHVSVAPDRQPDTFMVVLDRQKLEKARSEASVLRAVLKAIASGSSRRDALQRALATVSQSVAVSRLAFFELDQAGKSFFCSASTGLSDVDLQRVQPIANDQTTSLMAVALAHAKPVHVADLASTPGQLPFDAVKGDSAVLMPVGSRAACGVLYVTAKHDALNDGALRVIQALGDAVGAVLDLVALEAEASRAREVAAQRDRLATIGQLVAGVAHEINNPVAVLQGNLDVLRDVLGSKADGVQHELSLMDQQIHRINLMVSKLLQFASPTEFSGYTENVTVESVIGDALILLGPNLKKANVEVRRQDRVTLILNLNRNELQQVLINLITNAIYAMPQGGTLTLSSEDQMHEGVNGVSIRIADTGVGISPEALPKVFDAFFTTRPGQGTGLGLSISYTLVARYGGKITVDSALGQGTCFAIWLPAL